MFHDSLPRFGAAALAAALSLSAFSAELQFSAFDIGAVQIGSSGSGVDSAELTSLRRELQAAIDGEATSRATNDSALSAALAEEIGSREDGDTWLYGQMRRRAEYGVYEEEVVVTTNATSGAVETNIAFKLTGDYLAKESEVDAVSSNLATHVATKSGNPHGVTAADVDVSLATNAADGTATVFVGDGHATFYTKAKADERYSALSSTVSGVPVTRKVNGKPLSADITLSADDVHAVSSVNGQTGAVVIAVGEGAVSTVDLEGATNALAKVIAAETKAREGAGYITREDLPELGLVPDAGYAFYVSALTGDDSNDGLTASTAFRTIDRAYSAAEAGDSIAVLQGTYTYPASYATNKVGYATPKRLRFVGLRGAAYTTFVSGLSVANDPFKSGGGADGRIIGSLDSWWTEFDGFTFAYAAPVSWRPTQMPGYCSVKFSNCTFRDITCRAQRMYGRFYACWLQNCTFADCTFAGDESIGTGAGNNTHSFYPSLFESCLVENSSIRFSSPTNASVLTNMPISLSHSSTLSNCYVYVTGELRSLELKVAMSNAPPTDEFFGTRVGMIDSTILCEKLSYPNGWGGSSSNTFNYDLPPWMYGCLVGVDGLTNFVNFSYTFVTNYQAVGDSVGWSQGGARPAATNYKHPEWRLWRLYGYGSSEENRTAYVLLSSQLGSAVTLDDATTVSTNGEEVVTNVIAGVKRLAVDDEYADLATQKYVDDAIANATPEDYEAVSNAAINAVQSLTSATNYTDNAVSSRRSLADLAVYAEVTTVTTNAETGEVSTNVTTEETGDTLATTNGVEEKGYLTAETDPDFTKWKGGTSIAAGYEAAARGNYSSAMGYYAAARGDRSSAMGYGATASGVYSSAMGYGAKASGECSSAMGYYAAARGECSSAVGYNAIVDGDWSAAVGFLAMASGDRSSAIGYRAYAPGVYSSAMGYEATASGRQSSAMGYYAAASGTNSVAIGYGAKAVGDYAVAIGDAATGLPVVFDVWTNKTTTVTEVTLEDGSVSNAVVEVTEIVTNSSATAVGYANAAGYHSLALGYMAYAPADAMGLAYTPDRIYLCSSNTAKNAGSTARSLQSYLDERVAWGSLTNEVNALARALVKAKLESLDAQKSSIGEMITALQSIYEEKK